MASEDSKLVRLNEETYHKLRDFKFELKLDTFDQAVMALLEEHEEGKEAA